MADIFSQTELTAEGVTAPGDVWIALQNKQSGGNAGAKMSLSESLEYISGGILGSQVLEDTPPTISDPVGLYSVQTGTDRGLYWNTGAEVVLITPYSTDGTWPV